MTSPDTSGRRVCVTATAWSESQSFGGGGSGQGKTGPAISFGVLSCYPAGPVGFCGAVATASFDTISTEIGQWLGKHPFDPLTLRQVPVGTRGAVSLEGTVVGLMAALACWTVGWLTALVSLDSCVPVVGGATVASLLESILGSRGESTSEYFDGALNIFNTLLGACGATVLWLLV